MPPSWETDLDRNGPPGPVEGAEGLPLYHMLGRRMTHWMKGGDDNDRKHRVVGGMSPGGVPYRSPPFLRHGPPFMPPFQPSGGPCIDMPIGGGDPCKPQDSKKVMYACMKIQPTDTVPFVGSGCRIPCSPPPPPCPPPPCPPAPSCDCVPPPPPELKRCRGTCIPKPCPCPPPCPAPPLKQIRLKPMPCQQDVTEPLATSECAIACGRVICEEDCTTTCNPCGRVYVDASPCPFYCYFLQAPGLFVIAEVIISVLMVLLLMVVSLSTPAPPDFALLMVGTGAACAGSLILLCFHISVDERSAPRFCLCEVAFLVVMAVTLMVGGAIYVVTIDATDSSVLSACVGVAGILLGVVFFIHLVVRIVKVFYSL